MAAIEGSAGDDVLMDFTTSRRVLRISVLAVAIGALAAVVAWLLLRLIAFFTNLFFYFRFAAEPATPVDNQLGIFVVLVPVVGGLIVGIIAKYGSEKIRGHGIPEAIESILLNGSRVEPKLAVLKPISSAISIGSGGPFGAEGPIIMTGGAFGSMIAQFFRLTASERKTLLVSGAAAGMAATFGAPIAAVLLAVELLLFEWKPRSLVPVALASACAMATRRYFLEPPPLFPSPPHPADVGITALLGCLAAGLLAGLLALVLTKFVYASEDAFERLPIHWMWWPAIGGVVIGLGGLIFPHALGVGYDTIGSLVQGNLTLSAIAGILIVKSTIWAVSLGSGTSGGVLAPLLMIGGALGGLLSFVMPDQGAGFWPLVCMGAILGGAMRSPLTGIVFAMELTGDINMLLPLLVAVSVAHAVSVLTLGRSILTEKIARRGFHLSREYALDPLEITFAREVMRSDIVALPNRLSIKEVAEIIPTDLGKRVQHMYPVVDDEDRLVGIVTRRDLRRTVQEEREHPGGRMLADIVRNNPVVAYDDDTLRAVVLRMAETGLTRFPVVEREDKTEVVGSISLNNLLAARAMFLEAEGQRESIIKLPRVRGWRLYGRRAPTSADDSAVDE